MMTQFAGKKPEQAEISYEPIQNHFNVDFETVHISGTTNSFYKASPLDSDTPTSEIMLIERISDSNGHMDTIQWNSYWNRIQELENLSIQGLLKYYACHAINKPSGTGYDIMMVTEFADTSLQKYSLRK